MDIYASNEYFRNNPSMHIDDSHAKAQIALEMFRIERLVYREKLTNFLDIGGGSGVCYSEISSRLISQGGLDTAVFDTIEPSKECLNLQKRNNPYLRNLIQEPIEKMPDGTIYDLTFMFDVVEHLQDYKSVLAMLSCKTKYLLINIPLEYCLFDIIRNIIKFGRYYKHQREILGHIHRFSAVGSFKWLKKDFSILKSYNWPYCEHLLKLGQLGKTTFTKARLSELHLSKSISTLAPAISPMIVQGSKFILLKSNRIL